MRVQAARERTGGTDRVPDYRVIDLNGMTEGDYTVPVNISLPEGYEQVDSVQVSIQLRATPIPRSNRRNPFEKGVRGMVSKKVTVKNSTGLHLPSGRKPV